MPDLALPPLRPRILVPPTQTPGASGLMTLASGVVIVTALYVGRQVLIPVTLAVLLSFLLAPLVELLRLLRLGRVPAVLLAVVLALGVILGIGGVIGTQVAGLAGDIPHYADTIQEKLQSVQGATVGRLSGLFNRLQHQLEKSRKTALDGVADKPPKSSGGPADGTPAATGGSTAPHNASPIPVEIHQPQSTPVEIAERIVSPALAPIATTGIVFVVAIFILLQRGDLRDRLIRLFGANDLLRTITAMDEAARRLSRYFLSLLALNTAFGGVIGVGLLLIGVPMPMLWGILAGLLRFVPYFGSFLAAVLPVALAAAVDPGWSMVVWTVALFVVCESLMGQMIEPLVYGRSTGLSPLSVVIAAIFWGWLWGPIGLILSMPLTLCVVVLARHVDRLQFLDVLLGDRPALTPVESFYHRILAGKEDEVLEDAEQLLKDRSLSAYYDEVAIPGLRLAAVDVDRGVLSEPQIAGILDGVETLVDELADRDDREPRPAEEDLTLAGTSREQIEHSPLPAHITATLSAHESLPADWRSPSAVLCVAGRGALDGAAATMLAQLLDKHGLGAHVMPHAAVGSRAALAALDVSGVRMVCIVFVGISGSPVHLRYTVRRLRGRLPKLPILVGLWPAETPTDDRLRAAIEADRYITSLREAVAECLEQAAGVPHAAEPESVG
jgi:predicted PurR-regulated permease PerM